MSKGEKNLKRGAKMVNTLIAEEKESTRQAEEKAKKEVIIHKILFISYKKLFHTIDVTTVTSAPKNYHLEVYSK